ncbi:hypothetical protein ACP70R_008208 [Stipagrostis hirtigluma subsp. patula]
MVMAASRKRRWDEVAEQMVTAAAGGIADRAVSTVLGSYDGEAKSVDEQLEHLEWLATEVSSAVAEAERARIRSLPLRRWLWNLREAAWEGRAVARSFRRRRAEEGPRCGSGNALWDGARHLLRTFKNALLGDDDVGKLRCTLRKLELAAAGTGRFLRLLELEQAAPPAASSPAAAGVPRPAWTPVIGERPSPEAPATRVVDFGFSEIIRSRPDVGKTTPSPAADAPPPDGHEPQRDMLRELLEIIHRRPSPSGPPAIGFAVRYSSAPQPDQHAHRAAALVLSDATCSPAAGAPWPDVLRGVVFRVHLATAILNAHSGRRLVRWQDALWDVAVGMEKTMAGNGDRELMRTAEQAAVAGHAQGFAMVARFAVRPCIRVFVGLECSRSKFVECSLQIQSTQGSFWINRIFISNLSNVSKICTLRMFDEPQFEI